MDSNGLSSQIAFSAERAILEGKNIATSNQRWRTFSEKSLERENENFTGIHSLTGGRVPSRRT
jgi:hypothetical protein